MASSPFFEPTSQNISLCVAAGSLLYLWIAHSLRWKRYKAIHQKFGTKFREGGLTVQDAQEIMQVSGMWDMPELLKFALSYANVKTYAIPSISKLLYSTKQLSTVEHAPKRYADTGILTYTWVSCPISGRSATPDGGELSDPRSMIALGRVNWLHSRYRIANDEFLYTLALFILEYLRWTDKYGWRRLSEMEKQAVFIFWSEIGRQMKIRGIPESLHDLRYWVNEYELGHRREAQSNRDIIKFTNEYNSMVFPRIFGIRAIYEGILYCILEEPVRIAMMSPRQPWYMYAITNCVLHGLKYYQRHLALPNRRPFSMVPVELPTGPEVRMHPTVFEAKPWYKAQGRGLTWLVDYLSVWVGRREGLPGPQYRSEGYRLEEIGPLAYEHSGHEEVMKDAAGLYGCPIRAPWNMTSNAKM